MAEFCGDSAVDVAWDLVRWRDRGGAGSSPGGPQCRDVACRHRFLWGGWLGADTAVVLSKGAILFAEQAEPAPESRTLDGWVLCKHDGAWRVEAFHNCPEILA